MLQCFVQLLYNDIFLIMIYFIRISIFFSYSFKVHCLNLFCLKPQILSIQRRPWWFTIFLINVDWIGGILKYIFLLKFHFSFINDILLHFSISACNNLAFFGCFICKTMHFYCFFKFVSCLNSNCFNVLFIIILY